MASSSTADVRGASPAQVDSGYVSRREAGSRAAGEIFGVPGEDQLLRALHAKESAVRRMGAGRRQRSHGRRASW